MAWMVRRLCGRFLPRGEQWPAGAVSIALPTLLLDPFSSAFFPRGVSEYGSRNGGGVWRMDAVVLRGGAGRGDPPSRETGLRVRPKLLAAQDLPPAPRQKRSLEKRERLKAAGLLLFAKRGYEGTSIDEIARRARLAVGRFYQHFRSKRQLLLVLMDELLEKLSQLDFRPPAGSDVRAVVQELLARAFSHDLRYLGAYRAWQEAVLSDADLARKEQQIRAWTTSRVATLFQRLQKLPARPAGGGHLRTLARVMDSFFWSLLAQAVRMPEAELERWIDTATHLIYHAMFADAPEKRQR